MKICIAGWYFHGPLLTVIKESLIETFIVEHREGDTRGFRSLLCDNRGLEFGCYQKYLALEWDGVSDVLFMHDDGMAEATKPFYDIERLAENPDMDQGFIFHDEYEEFVNQGHHGRAFWCRGSWLAKFSAEGGFRPDMENRGDTEGCAANDGIANFAAQLHGDPRLGWCAIVPGLHMGRRGKLDGCYQFKRSPANRGLMTPP